MKKSIIIFIIGLLLIGLGIFITKKHEQKKEATSRPNQIIGEKFDTSFFNTFKADSYININTISKVDETMIKYNFSIPSNYKVSSLINENLEFVKDNMEIYYNLEEIENVEEYINNIYNNYKDNNDYIYITTNEYLKENYSIISFVINMLKDDKNSNGLYYNQELLLLLNYNNTYQVLHYYVKNEKLSDSDIKYLIDNYSINIMNNYSLCNLDNNNYKCTIDYKNYLNKKYIINVDSLKYSNTKNELSFESIDNSCQIYLKFIYKETGDASNYLDKIYNLKKDENIKKEEITINNKKLLKIEYIEDTYVHSYYTLTLSDNFIYIIETEGSVSSDNIVSDFLNMEVLDE